MTLLDYLASFSSQNEVYLIGPFYKGQEYQEPVIFVDSAASFKKDGIGYSVGDNDSFAGVLDEVLPKEKDYSDLAAVLRRLPATINKVELLGFLGGRKDHELAVILDVLHFFKQQGGAKRARWDGGKVEVLSQIKQVYDYQGIFSVFNFSESNEVCIQGSVKYPTDSSVASFSSHGLSNEAQGCFSITTKEPLLVYFI